MILQLLGVIGLSGLLANPSMNNSLGGSYYEDKTDSNTIVTYGISSHYIVDFIDTQYEEGYMLFWFDNSKALHIESFDSFDYSYLNDSRFKYHNGIIVTYYEGELLDDLFYLDFWSIRVLDASINYSGYDFYLSYQIFPYTLEYNQYVEEIEFYSDYPYLEEEVNYNNANPNGLYSDLHFPDDFNIALPFAIPSLTAQTNSGWQVPQVTEMWFDHMPTDEYFEDSFYINFNYRTILSIEDLDGSAYQSGYQDGRRTGYQEGYNYALDYLGAQSPVAQTIFTGIINVALIPINFFLACLNFEVFGINIGGFVSALLTVCIVIIIVRMITGKKSDGD